MTKLQLEQREVKGILTPAQAEELATLRAAEKNVKVSIALKDAMSGEQLKWQYPDMVNNDYAIESVKVFDGVGKTSKKPYKAFEIQLEGREEPVRVLPIRAVDMGIAAIVDEGVEIIANTLTAKKTESSYELEIVD